MDRYNLSYVKSLYGVLIYIMVLQENNILLRNRTIILYHISCHHFAIKFINRIEEMQALTLSSFCRQNEKSEQMKKVKKVIYCTETVFPGFQPSEKKRKRER